MPATPDSGPAGTETILAFDFGLRRIGVAVGQSVTMSASPLGVVRNSESGPDFGAIAGIIGDWQPTRLVVGVPMQADGSAGELHAPIEAFIRELRRYGIEISTVDERYSSLEAEALLKTARASGRRGRVRKEDIDSAAAVMIAERFLTGQPNV